MTPGGAVWVLWLLLVLVGYLREEFNPAAVYLDLLDAYLLVGVLVSDQRSLSR